MVLYHNYLITKFKKSLFENASFCSCVHVKNKYIGRYIVFRLCYIMSLIGNNCFYVLFCFLFSTVSIKLFLKSGPSSTSSFKQNSCLGASSSKTVIEYSLLEKVFTLLYCLFYFTAHSSPDIPTPATPLTHTPNSNFGITKSHVSPLWVSANHLPPPPTPMAIWYVPH